MLVEIKKKTINAKTNKINKFSMTKSLLFKLVIDHCTVKMKY